MSEKIEQIKELLDDLSKELRSESDVEFVKNFDALEIPEIVASVVDLLQPNLTPIEAAVYWYLLRHTIISKGQQYIQIGTKTMTGLATSSRKKTETLDFKSIRTAIQELIEKDAVKVVGETTNVGTPYKINLPEEIPLCQEILAQEKKLNKINIETEVEIDFYNVRENRLKVFERDGYKCHYCSKQLTRFNATLDHLQPVSEGGDDSYDNLITSCLHCNSRRGNRPVMEAIINGKTKDGNS